MKWTKTNLPKVFGQQISSTPGVWELFDLGQKKQLHPGKLTCPPKKGTISIGNTSTPTIDFQGTFVSFQGG